MRRWHLREFCFFWYPVFFSAILSGIVLVSYFNTRDPWSGLPVFLVFFPGLVYFIVDLIHRQQKRLSRLENDLKKLEEQVKNPAGNGAGQG